MYIYIKHKIIKRQGWRKYVWSIYDMMFHVFQDILDRVSAYLFQHAQDSAPLVYIYVPIF